jgi:hypothetical protein
VLIGSSTLYQSYDEGDNVIITIPYLDANAYDAIVGDGISDLEYCLCSAASRRNRVTSERRAILMQSLDDPEDVDMDVDSPDDLGLFSSSPLTDIDSDLPGPSSRVLPALDGPHVVDVAGLMEPDGPVNVQGESQGRHPR